MNSLSRGRIRGIAAVLVSAVAVLCTSGAAPAKGQTSPRPVPVEVTGADVAEFDAAAKVWLLRGRPVVITRGPLRVEAARIRYDERAGLMVASGGVRIHHERMTMQAPTVEGRLREQYVLARGGVVITDRQVEGEPRLTAARVQAWLQSRRLVADGSPVLTRRDTRLTGAQMTYDSATAAATVTGGATLVLPQGRLTADRIDGNLREETAVASGQVRFAGKEITGQARSARLDQRGGQVTLAGEAVIRRGDDQLTAETIAIDLRTEKVTASGNPRLVIAPRD